MSSHSKSHIASWPRLLEPGRRFSVIKGEKERESRCLVDDLGLVSGTVVRGHPNRCGPAGSSAGQMPSAGPARHWSLTLRDRRGDRRGSGQRQGPPTVNGSPGLAERPQDPPRTWHSFTASTSHRALNPGIIFLARCLMHASKEISTPQPSLRPEETGRARLLRRDVFASRGGPADPEFTAGESRKAGHTECRQKRRAAAVIRRAANVGAASDARAGGYACSSGHEGRAGPPGEIQSGSMTSRLDPAWPLPVEDARGAGRSYGDLPWPFATIGGLSVRPGRSTRLESQIAASSASRRNTEMRSTR